MSAQSVKKLSAINRATQVKIRLCQLCNLWGKQLNIYKRNPWNF